MRRFMCSTAAVVLCASCAHSAQNKSKDDEVTALRARVVLMERRLSDIDATLKLLADKKMAQAPQMIDGIEEVGAIDLNANDNPRLDDFYVRDDGANEDTFNDAPFEQPLPKAEKVAHSPSRALGDATSLYKKAHMKRKSSEHDEARALFETISTNFPKHKPADNALYWNARCAAEQGAGRKAIELWKVLPLRFPQSPKLPDALYGMAKAHESLGEPVLAEMFYSQLVEQFPKAEATPEAKRALQRLAGL